MFLSNLTLQTQQMIVFPILGFFEEQRGCLHCTFIADSGCCLKSTGLLELASTLPCRQSELGITWVWINFTCPCSCRDLGISHLPAVRQIVSLQRQTMENPEIQPSLCGSPCLDIFSHA